MHAEPAVLSHLTYLFGLRFLKLFAVDFVQRMVIDSLAGLGVLVIDFFVLI